MFKKLSVPLCFLGILSVGFSSLARAEPLPNHDHAHDCATAAQIPLNSDTKATLESTSDLAVYGITLNERGLLDVSADPGTMDTWGMELLDSSCQPVPKVVGAVSMLTGSWAEIAVPHKDFLFPASDSVWTLGPDVYYVRIRPNPVDVFREQFTFHTKFVPHRGHDCATADAIGVPGTIEGELLYAEDREVFRITTTEPGQIHAWTGEPLILLRLPDCSSRLGDQGSDPQGTEVIGATLAKGTYYLSAEPLNPDQLGRFTLHVEFIPAGRSAQSGGSSKLWEENHE